MRRKCPKCGAFAHVNDDVIERHCPSRHAIRACVASGAKLSDLLIEQAENGVRLARADEVFLADRVAILKADLADAERRLAAAPAEITKAEKALASLRAKLAKGGAR